MALEVRDLVLVHVTAFKGHHKIQDWWENREYVLEKWPYPNVPVYVVCPRDWEGCSQTLHRNYLLPISPNIQQSKMDKPVVGVGNDTSLTPVPPVDMMHHLGTALEPLEPASLEISRYSLLDDAGPTSIWYAWVGLHIGLFMVFCLHTIFWKEYSATCTLLITSSVYQAQLTSGETSQVDSWAWKGVDCRTFGPVATPLPMRNSPKIIPVEV